MNEITKRGIAALRVGDRITARSLLNQAIQQDPDDVTAWLWLTGALDQDEARIDALKQVLRIDPGNQAAARGLSQLLAQQEKQPASEAAIEQPAPSLEPPSPTLEPPAPTLEPPLPMEQPAVPLELALEPDPAQEIMPDASPAESQELYSDLRETYSNNTMPISPPAANQPVPASDPHKTQPVRARSFETDSSGIQIQPDLDKTAITPPEKVAEFEAKLASLNKTEVSTARLQTAIAEAIIPNVTAAESRRRRMRATAEGLQTIFRTRPSIVPALVGFWLFLIGTAAVAILLRGSDLLAVVISLMVGVMLMAIVGYVIVSILAVRYELTNQYLAMPYRGKKVRVMLDKITLAQCHQTFFQRLLGTGDAHLKATVNFELVTLRLRNIPECQRRVDQIISAVEAAGGVRVRSQKTDQR